MIITKQREWQLVLDDLVSVAARSVFVVGCGECATAAHTGGESEVAKIRERLSTAGLVVTGSTIPEVTCHAGGVKLEVRKHATAVDSADAVLVLACGAGTQTVADVVTKPVLPGLESVFLGTIVRNGMFEERCQMCGECVLGDTGGICPVTACPKGLLNGPCGGMWDGMCEVVHDRACAHVQIRERLTRQGRDVARTLAPTDHSKKLKPAKLDVRVHGRSGRAR